MIQILSKKQVDQKNKVLSSEEIEDILRMLVGIIPEKATSAFATLSSSSNDPNAVNLQHIYLDAIKQQVSHILYQKKAAEMSAISSAKLSTFSQSSSSSQNQNSILSQKTQFLKNPAGANSLLSQEVKDQRLKRKYEDIVGMEELSSTKNKLASDRAKRILLSSQAKPLSALSQDNKTTSLFKSSTYSSSSIVGSTSSNKMDLFSRIQNFNSSTSSSSLVSKTSNTVKPGETVGKENLNNKRLQCIICKDTANIPCVSKTCGHICCQSCWMTVLTKNPVCPMCRQPVQKENISKVVIRPATSEGTK
jgi:hypothetical protein